MRVRGTIGTLAFASAIALAAPVAAQDAATVQAAPVAATVPARLAAPVALPRVKRHHAKGDPLEGFNRTMFKVFRVLDRFLYRPVAIAYKTVVPKLLRTGIRHVFSNAGEPIVFLNDVLQLKPKRAVRTFGRFIVNSTFGIGGILDVAKTRSFGVPHHDNGFGNTLGRYGVGPGPYLFLPFVGPSSFRDLVGDGADGAVLPYTIGTPFDRVEYQVPHTVAAGLDQRVESDAELRALEAGAVDVYASLRSSYLQNRAATIAELRHGADAPPAALDDPLTDPGAGTDPVPSAPVPGDPATPTPAPEPSPVPSPSQ